MGIKRSTFGALALVGVLVLAGCGDGNAATPQSSEKATVTVAPTTASAIPSTPAAQPTPSPTFEPVTAELIPQEGFVKHIKRPTGKGGKIVCGDEKIVTDIPVELGGKAGYNGVTIATTVDESQMHLTVSISGPSSIYALIINGGAKVTDVPLDLQRASSSLMYLNDNSWEPIKQITACAELGPSPSTRQS